MNNTGLNSEDSNYLEDLINNSTDLIWVIKDEKQENLYFQKVNKTFLKYIRLKSENPEGKKVEEILSGECFSNLKTALKAAKRKGVIITCEDIILNSKNNSFESRIVHKPLKNGKSLYIGFTKNINSFSQIEDVLEREKNLNKAFLDTAGVIIIILDKKGNVELLNKKGSEFLGFSKNAVIGKNWFKNFIPSDNYRKINNHFKELMNGKAPEKYFENKVITHNGEEKFVRWHSAVITNKKGVITGLICSGEDITENSKLQDDLVTQSRNSDFLYVLSRAIIETSDLQDLITKASKLIADFPGMLGGFICLNKYNELVNCSEEIYFGSYKKINKDLRELFKEKLNNPTLGANLQKIEDLYYKHYGNKNKAYAGIYKIKAKNENQGFFVALTSYMDATLNNFLMVVASELGRAIARKKAEIAQKLSEEKFLTIFNTSPDAIIITTLDEGICLEANRTFEELTGFKRNEIINKNVHSVPIWVVPEERERLVKKLKVEKKVVGYMAKLRKKNGTFYNALISASMMYFNNVKCMITVLKDISDRVKIEDDARETKQLIEKIAFTSPSFICLYDVTEDKVLYSNKSILESLGYTKDDIDVFNKFGKGHKKSFYHPDDIAGLNEFDKRMNELKEGEIAKFEYRLKDAKSKWQWFQQTATLFHRSKDNEKVLTINVFENITDRKLAEEARIKQSKEVELLYQAGKTISGTLDLYEIYDRMYEIISSVSDCKELIVTSYDPSKQMIYYKYLRSEAANDRVDVSNIPPIPLAPRGYGIVSEVIRTGNSMIIDDYSKYFSKVKTRYVVSDKGDIESKEEHGTQTPKSALILPLKQEEKILGVVQVFSSKYKAYNTEHLRFVESLLHQVALANKNAMIFEQAQNEIRERKIAQENLKISERNLRQFAESVPDIIYRLNYETRQYDFISPSIESMLGYPLDEITSDPFEFDAKVIHPEDFEYVKNAVANHLKYGKVNRPLTVECRLIKSSGEIIWVRDSILFEYKQGKITAAIGVMSDITEKKMMEVKRRERDERIIRYQSVLLELSKLHSMDLSANLRKITEITTGALGIERTGIWLFDDDRKNLDCKDRYYNKTAVHESDFSLPLNKYSDLIKVLKTDEKITFGNKERESQIKGYNEFFTLDSPNSSSLIIRIHYHGDIAGFLSLESSEENKNEWTPEEYDFAVSVAGFISRVIESNERLRAQEEIKKNLKDKEMLLREIHHRVKNNLQVISSLLFLQSKKSTDQKMNAALIESQDRVKTMVMIHEKLYKSEDLASFNYGEYIKELTKSLFSSYKLDTAQISLELDVGNIILDTDTAVHCGLIINEAVSNSIKYAFPENREGKIYIKFHCVNDTDYALLIKDNGIGLNKKLDIDSFDTLGMQLIRTLTEQLNGTLKVSSDKGVSYNIKFSLKKRI